MSRLYTYLPKDNTALTEGLLSTALSDKGFEKYRGRTGKHTKEDVLKVLDSWEPEWTRSKAISALTEPIPPDAADDFLEFAKNRKLYSFSTKDLIKAKILAHLRRARNGGGTDPVDEVKKERLNWHRKKKHYLFQGVPHYFVETTGGRIPPEFVREEKVAEHGLTKEAKNITKLLARVGPDLAGATERDLKFIARRGLKGLTSDQVNALRARGFLPTRRRILYGFNKGTNNMFRGIGTGTEPVRAVVRKKGLGATNAHVDPMDSSVIIPATSTPGTLAEMEMRAAVARHEAREWVRWNGLKKNLGLSNEDFYPVTPEGKVRPTMANAQVFGAGSSHLPGVMYDERIFRSQLSNSLGIGTSWDKMPLGSVGNRSRAQIVRGSRDAYIGNKPLKYDYDIRKELIRRHKLFMAEAAAARERMVKAIVRDGARGEELVGIGNYIGKIRSKFPDLKLSDKQLRSLLMDFDPSHTYIGLGSRGQKIVADALMGNARLKASVTRYRDYILRKVNKRLARRFGAPVDDFSEGVFYPVSPGGELERVTKLSPEPIFIRQEPLKKRRPRAGKTAVT